MKNQTSSQPRAPFLLQNSLKTQWAQGLLGASHVCGEWRALCGEQGVTQSCELPAEGGEIPFPFLEFAGGLGVNSTGMPGQLGRAGYH